MRAAIREERRLARVDAVASRVLMRCARLETSLLDAAPFSARVRAWNGARDDDPPRRRSLTRPDEQAAHRAGVGGVARRRAGGGGTRRWCGGGSIWSTYYASIPTRSATPWPSRCASAILSPTRSASKRSARTVGRWTTCRAPRSSVRARGRRARTGRGETGCVAAREGGSVRSDRRGRCCVAHWGAAAPPPGARPTRIASAADQCRSARSGHH